MTARKHHLGPLDGTALVRFIYTDEAGTSANEPVTVVVALVVDADTQWMPAFQRISALLERVPATPRRICVPCKVQSPSGAIPS